MQERRRTPRHRCKLRCNVLHGKKQDAATIVDVSLSGLCIQTALPLAQGDAVRVEFLEPMRIQIKALAWNVRRMRKSGEVTNVVGMMLSEVGPEYEVVVGRISGGSSGDRASRGADTSSSGSGSSAASAAGGGSKRLTPVRGMPLPSQRLPWWKLRVKETGGNKSRVLTLAAATAEEASAKALQEMGKGWEVVDVKANAG
jgi:hypothetical protein